MAKSVNIKKVTSKYSSSQLNDGKIAIVSEAAAMYRSMPAAQSAPEKNFISILSWLGMRPAGAKKNFSEFDFIKLGSDGITKQAISKLAGHLGISKVFITENILDFSVKTLERKTEEERMDKRISSHALEIARLYQHAFEVFRAEEKVQRWLSKENRALNKMRPIDLLDTFSGLLLVDDILGRIEEGVYS